ncbi:MAG: cupin domain-containing protein [Pseudomonadales bacterium]|nr:cupin domain-containing protein [Pseudomonadales bacterium]
MLNMDFSQRVVINTNQQNWLPSPMPGVRRKPLAREEAEQGHATSIVQYQPGASFSPHDHPLGEEILVLQGTFSDDTGDYKSGMYFRNPEGFHHAPFSKEGCIILVKLHQFQDQDNQHLMINTKTAPFSQTKTVQPEHEDLEVLPLHQFKNEQVSLVRLSAGQKTSSSTLKGGEEIYVISGELIDEYGHYPAGTWLRNPSMAVHQDSGQQRYVEQETLIWLKSGHL